MAVLDSCPKHNMVAYLEKSEGNEEFHEIIDVVQGRSFLQKDHLKHTYTLPAPTSEVTYEPLSGTERPSEALPTPSPAPTSVNPSPRPSPTNAIPASIPETSGDNLGGHSSSDKSLSGNEGDMTIQGVYDLCLSLCKQISDQAKEIQALKTQITKLKKQAKPVIKHHKVYLQSVSLKQRFPRKSFSKKHRVHKEYVSKQGRKFAKGESSVQRDPLLDEMPEDKVDHMETENAQSEGRTREMGNEDKDIDERMLSTEDVLSTDKEGVSTDFEKLSTDRPIVSTDGSKVSTDMQVEGAEDQVKGTDEHNEGTEDKNEGTEEQREGTEEKVESTDGQVKGTEDQTEEEIDTQATQTSTQTPTSMIFGDDETIAKVLLNMSQAKAVSKEKEKGVELKDVEETDRPRHTSTRSLLTLKPLPKIDPKDKGKKKIEEEDESKSESDGIPQAEKKFRKPFEKQFTIEERAKFLHDTIAAQRKFLAQQRSEAIRNKPPTKNQLRNQMMTYLKHVGNYKHAELKIKKFEEVQALYEKIKRSDEDFISIGSAEDERLIKRMNEKGVGLSKSEVIKEESKEEVQEEDKDEESTRKRKLGTRKKMKSRKRRYIQYTSEDDSDKENDELRLYLTIAQDEEKEVDYEILDRKYPIKEWKTECLELNNKLDQSEHLEDLNAVYQLVMDKYQDEMPEGFDRVLWGDLMVLFNSDDKDEFWSSQLDWIIMSWKLHSSSGIHTLVTDTESEEENTMALELIKFVKKILGELESEEHKNWLVHKQTACGKDFSNPFMVDNLPKIVGLSTHLASVVKSWLVHDQTVHALASPKANELTIPEQTATVAEKTKLLLKKDRVYKFKKCLQEVKDYLGKCFSMKDLGEAAFILGIKIYKDRSRRLIGLSQNAYLDKILKRYKMDNSKRGSIRMQVDLYLNKSQCATTSAEMKRMQNVPYVSAVGSIMYVVRCTRPDVAFAPNITSRFQQNPGEAHWTAVKNILKYLRNTKDTFLVYGGNPEAELQVKCYCDTGFETDRDDTKSQTRYVFVLNGGAVVWKSSKQSTTAQHAT
ncbi:hypothetical protein Tco_0820515 [Tanacetum coccineum]|uniref:Reverse transcriptase Ty1/copia-type domain-containing protein n=1 Tax=Tanacetum coccineum TaxID=301880 RepID=A0ABQ5A9M7_9ASTR